MEPTDPTKPVGKFRAKRVDDRRPNIAWVHPADAHGVLVELRKRESYESHS